MPCILLLSGALSSNIDLLIQYLSKHYSFYAEKLPELTADDFETDEHGDEFINPNSKSNLIERTNHIVKRCTDEWKCNKIVFPFYFREQLDVLPSRPYISLIEIKEPFMKRFNNFKSHSNTTIEDFAKLNDLVYFKTDLYKIQNYSRHIIDVSDEKTIVNSIQEDIFLKRISDGIYRPSIDEYFMSIAFISKLRSNCMKRPVGAVVVKNNRILSIGYNGTPSGLKNCFEGGCERCNKNISKGLSLDKCFCLHAEEAAILEIGSKICEGATLYSTLFPCNWCSKVVVQCVG